MSAQRVLVAMMDGLGMDYFEGSDMPFARRMAREGLFARVGGVFPSVTNANNVSIATGKWPDEHGISANSIYVRGGAGPEYLNDSASIACPTVFDRAASRGVKSALLTCKRKTKELFLGRASVAIAAEELSPSERGLFGPAPGVYSREVNYWLWEAAAILMETRSDIGLVYVHTTDYPMHAWAPGEAESLEHLSRIDELVSRLAASNGDAAILLTADHGMNAKKRAWDLGKACAARGAPIEFALSPERDYYAPHHRNLTGCAWVWLERESDRSRVSETIASLEGIEAVLDAARAAPSLRVDPERLGDLVVLGDADTMFGELDSEAEELPRGYRAHGSLHEMDLPLIVYNYRGALPPAGRFKRNMDLCSFIYRDPP